MLIIFQIKIIIIKNFLGDVGIEENSGSDGKAELSEVVRACVEEG